MDCETITAKTISAINALSTFSPTAPSLFSEEPNFTLTVYLQNKPQTYTFQFATPAPALSRALVIAPSTLQTPPVDAKTFDQCKVLFKDFKLRTVWMKQYTHIVTPAEFLPELEKYFGAKFLEKRPVFTYEDAPRSISGAKVSGTQFQIALGTYENALKNAKICIENLEGNTKNFDNLQQLHVSFGPSMCLPVVLKAPKVGLICEEIYTEKDVLDELFDGSIDELIKQGILSQKEADEARGKGAARALI